MRGEVTVVCRGRKDRVDHRESLKALEAPELKNVTPAHEQGLTNFDATTWNGFFLPRNTPAAIVQELNSAASTVVDTPLVQAKLQEIGATVVVPDRRSPAYLQAFVESAIKKWAAPIEAANLTVN